MKKTHTTQPVIQAFDLISGKQIMKPTMLEDQPASQKLIGDNSSGFDTVSDHTVGESDDEIDENGQLKSSQLVKLSSLEPNVSKNKAKLTDKPKAKDKGSVIKSKMKFKVSNHSLASFDKSWETESYSGDSGSESSSSYKVFKKMHKNKSMKNLNNSIEIMKEFHGEKLPKKNANAKKAGKHKVAGLG